MITTSPRRTFYGRWILANGCAECLGLGSTLTLGAWVARAGPALDGSPATVLLAACGAILAGTLLEGILLGSCQAGVLHAALPTFQSWRWVRATAVGAACAWTVGMLPSTLMSLVDTHPAAVTATAPHELPLSLTLLLAAGMGAVLGPFLGIPQGRVLRTHGLGVGRWVAANSLAWTLGMPVVFLATPLIDSTSGLGRVAAALGGASLLAGFLVGAIHGRFLLPLLPATPDAT